MEMEAPESSCFPHLYWIWVQRPKGPEATFLLSFSHTVELALLPTTSKSSHRTAVAWTLVKGTAENLLILSSQVRGKYYYTEVALHRWKLWSDFSSARICPFMFEQCLISLCSNLIKVQDQLYRKNDLCSLPFLWFRSVNCNLNFYIFLGYL